MVKTNLYGTFFGTKHAIPHMAKRNAGHIINLYGGGGVKPGGAGTYMVTKDGIRTFSRYVAEEVRDSNICVVTFSPRVPIATDTAPAEALQRLPGPDVLGPASYFARNCHWIRAANALPMRTASWSMERCVKGEAGNGYWALGKIRLRSGGAAFK